MSSLGFLSPRPVGRESLCPRDDDDVVEISLLLTGRQVEALESTAHDQGLTAGEMVRQLLDEFLHRGGAR